MAAKDLHEYAQNLIAYAETKQSDKQKPNFPEPVRLPSGKPKGGRK